MDLECTIQMSYDRARDIRSWVVSCDIRDLLKDKPILIDAHKKVSDAYISEIPFLISVVDYNKPKYGCYFPDIYEISPDMMQIDNTFLVNDVFMERCCGTDNLFSFLGIISNELYGTDKEIIINMNTWHKNLSFHLIGVWR